MVRRLSATRSNQMQQLFEREEMGDRTPSQFLCHMRTLVGESVTDEFLKMWLSRLPQAVRTVTSGQCAGRPVKSISRRGRQGKRYNAESRSPLREHRSGPGERAADRYHLQGPEKDEMRRDWRKLCSQMTKIMKAFAQTSVRQTTRARSKSRQRRRSKLPAVSSYFWYHQTFGDRSTKCKSPCNFQSGNEESRH